MHTNFADKCKEIIMEREVLSRLVPVRTKHDCEKLHLRLRGFSRESLGEPFVVVEMESY